MCISPVIFSCALFMTVEEVFSRAAVKTSIQSGIQITRLKKTNKYQLLLIRRKWDTYPKFVISCFLPDVFCARVCV